MERLGYDAWFAHGGDWGAAVTTELGVQRPAGLLGIHLSTPYAFPAVVPDVLSADEQRAVDGLAYYAGELGGSNHLQGTKPQTVGFALADSPVGQATWIYEKYQSKTDNAGRAEDAIPVDRILDQLSLAWFTNSAASSARIYWDNRSASMAGPHLDLPVAVTVFPGTSRGCHAAGWSRRTATWCTSPRPSTAGTSPRWNSPRCSSTSSGRGSGASDPTYGDTP